MSDLSDLSDLKRDLQHSVQEKSSDLSLETRSEIASDAQKNPIREDQKPDLALTGMTGLTTAMAERSVENNTGIKFLKCPQCKFENIHQHVIEHHLKYKHGVGLPPEEGGGV